MNAVQITVKQARRKITQANVAIAAWKRLREPECRRYARQLLEEARLLLALADWEQAHE